MVKLIKMVGDSNVNSVDRRNGVINNTFHDSITIEPNSRIALRSCQVNLAADDDKQVVYEVGTGDNVYKYRINGGINDAFTEVTIPVDTYENVSSVLDAMQIAANSTAPPSSTEAKYNGVHNVYNIANGSKTSLESYKANPARADFTQWYFEKGNPAVTLNTLNIAQSLIITDAGSNYTTATGLATLGGSGTGLLVDIVVDGASTVQTVTIANEGSGGYVAGDVLTVQQGGSGNDCQFEVLDTNGVQLNVIPLVRSTQTFTVNTVGNFLWVVTALDNIFLQAFGVGIQGSTGAYEYLTLFNGSVFPRAEVPADGDEVSILKNGSSVTITVTRAGAELFTETRTLNDEYLREQNLMNSVNAPVSSTAILGNAETMTLELEAGSDVGVNHGIRLETNGINIFRDLGYTNGNRFDDNGAPTNILSVNQATGTLNRSGFIVALEGLDLDTYVGSTTRARGGVNILDVLFADPSDPRVITQQINFPMPLDVKNQRSTVIRDLRVRFLNNDLKPITYTGQPSVVLELYGPDEST